MWSVKATDDKTRSSVPRLQSKAMHLISRHFTSPGPSSVHLLAPQSDGRIQLASPPRRQISRHERYSQKQQRHPNIHPRRPRDNCVRKRTNRIAPRESQPQSAHQPARDPNQRRAQNRPDQSPHGWTPAPCESQFRWCAASPGRKITLYIPAAAISPVPPITQTRSQERNTSKLAAHVTESGDPLVHRLEPKHRLIGIRGLNRSLDIVQQLRGRHRGMHHQIHVRPGKLQRRQVHHRNRSNVIAARANVPHHADNRNRPVRIVDLPADDVAPQPKSPRRPLHSPSPP